MIASMMTIKEDETEEAVNLHRIVKTEGSNEAICMDLRSIAYGIRKRIEEKAKSKEAREAMRTMYENAFAEGFRISQEELEDQDREVYIRIIAEELAEVDEDELKEVLRA
jgi:hypothetical protein